MIDNRPGSAYRKGMKPPLRPFAARPSRPGRPPHSRQESARQESARQEPARQEPARPAGEISKGALKEASGRQPRDKSRFAPKPKPPKPALAEDSDLLYGIHSVREALLNPRRRHRRLLATENALQRLTDGISLPLAPEIVKPEAINRLLPADAVHQGALLETARLPYLRPDQLPQDRIIVALDQVTDPHNVGAILRSAAAFGVGALLTTFRHSPDLSGVLAKAASGALEHVPIAGATNLGRALTELREGGYQIIGLDSEAPEPMHALAPRLPLVLVLGAEGKGLRQSTRALCDHLARLDLPGAIRSLNVSNAAAIALYAVTQGLARGR